jgi:hypothetical protein
MFDRHIIDVLKRNERKSIREHPDMMDYPIRPLHPMRGGIRYGAHPVPELHFQPDTLATGHEMYSPSPKRSKSFGSSPRRLVGGKGHRMHLTELQNGMEHQRGGSLKSFGRSVLKGLKHVGKEIVMPVVKDFATKQGRRLLEKGLQKYVLPAAEEAAPFMLAAGRRIPKKSYATSSGHDKRESRGLLIRKIMHQHGCSLVEASRYIKEHGLKY